MLYTGVVTEAPSHSGADGNYHAVHCSIKALDRDHIKCAVTTGNRGDVTLPTEGSMVLLATVNGFIPVVVGIIYDPAADADRPQIPDYVTGERMIGHDPTSSVVHIDENGECSFETSQVELRTENNTAVADNLSGATPQSVLTSDTLVGYLDILGQTPHHVADEQDETTLKTT